MVSQPPPTAVGLVFKNLEASSRVAQLEAEIAQLKDALAWRHQIGAATGCWPSASPSPRAGLVTAGTPLPELPFQGPRHRSGRDRRALRSTQQAEVEILSAIEMHLRNGVRLIAAQPDGQRPISEACSDAARHVPPGRP
jgi:hypothetical protein